MPVRAVAGLDGCPGGWVVVSTSLAGAGTTSVRRVSDLAGVLAALDARELAAVGIDIPIGLPDGGTRRCDVEARRLIGPRRSSVFPAPLRGLLGAPTYEDAATRCRALSGRGLSRQVFGILAKVGEVDLLMTPRRQQHMVEVHPEVSFTMLSGGPMASSKKTAPGRAQRLDALREVFPDVDLHAGRRMSGTRPDDVLDAFAAAWSAWRWSTGTHVQLGGDRDARGLRMEIIG